VSSANTLAPMLATEPDVLKTTKTLGAHTSALASLIARYVEDPGWVLERKYDGDRMMVDILNGHPTAIGRDGQIGAACKHHDRMRSTAYLAAFSRMPARHCLLDCELVDGALWVFDLVTIGDPDGFTRVHPEDPLSVRRSALEDLFATWEPGPLFHLAAQATTAEDKCALALACIRDKAEGLVAKRRDSPYQLDRQSLDWVKLKPIHEADLVVMALGVDGRDNAVLGAYDGGEVVEVGHASTHGKAAMSVNDVVVVRYDHFTAGGRLHFPRIMRRRGDKPAAACTIDQLVGGRTRA
jgi:ATP-dependent DNA ligase